VQPLTAGGSPVKSPGFEYAKARSIADVFALTGRYGDGARILAGGQSLVPSLNMRLSEPRVLIDINGLDELRGIRVAGDVITIGALTRHREIERSRELDRHLPLLRLAAPHIGHVAIRNRGTFGGSIAFADPAAELPACCLALDAVFRIASESGERRVRARKFFTGLYETALAPGELLVAGEFPLIHPGYRSAFAELSRRQGDYAIVGAAVRARVDAGIVSDLSAAFFGVGASPILAVGVAAALEGRTVDAATVEAAQAALDRDIDPIGDAYQSAATKRYLARTLLGRLVGRLGRD